MTDKPDKIIIAFAGHIGSGKDEACKYLEAVLAFTHMKFAHPIQDIIAILGGFYKPDKSHRFKFNDRTWKESTVLTRIDNESLITIRQALKIIGTDLFRDNFKSDIWTESLYKSISHNTGLVCISDLRFPNELEFIHKTDYPWNTTTYDKRYEGYLIYIDNPIAFKQAEASGMLEHPSERHHEYLKSEADYIIYNNPETNSLDRFKTSVYEVVQDILTIN